MKIEPGMFIKIKSLSIYFEVQEVFLNMVVCASRNPSDKTELVFRDNIEYSVHTPPSGNWIKLNREKGFYDKFYPEGWQPTIFKVIPFSDIEAGMTLVGFKGTFKPVTKKGNTWTCTGSQKTYTSKNNDSFITQVIQVEGKV